MKKEKYADGITMEAFSRIDKISSYNLNYYIGIDGDLLFAKSDDDNETEWWILIGTNSELLGYSYTTEGDILHKSDVVYT